MDAESSKRIELDSVLHDECLNLNLHRLSLKDLREITNDFSDENLLGQGGFGTVHKGQLQNGNIIAVKKLFTSTMPGLQDKQYENEVHHLMRLIHPNIVQLVGYCSETEKCLVLHNGTYVYAEKSEKLLCLEYMPKGSLRNHISDASSGLDWQTRYKIIVGTCRGLHYLHEEWKPSTPIIHRDLKPANILLDDNMVPKIADFGLSRLFGEEQTRTTTKNFDGTLGYMAPEYLHRGIITKGLDIFSLGVIIIQIVTGRKHYPYTDNETSSQEFIELVVKEWRNRLEKVPGYTSQEFDCQQIRLCIDIGLLCVKDDRAQRPTTSQIIEILALKDAECSNKREAYELLMSLDKFSKQLQTARPGCSEVKEPSSTLSSSRNAGAYYRCAHRRSQGCPATKKVQRTDDDPTIFDVIYHGEHTCVQRPGGAAAAAGQPENWGVSPATSDSNNHVATAYLPFEDAEWQENPELEENPSAPPTSPAVIDFDDLDVANFFVQELRKEHEQELRLAGRHKRGSPLPAGAPTRATQPSSNQGAQAARRAADAADPPCDPTAFGSPQRTTVSGGGGGALLLLLLLALVCVVAVGRAPVGAVCCCICASWWCRGRSAAEAERSAVAQ